MTKFNVGEQFEDRRHETDVFLLREAAHRYKNLLSVVRAIANQTGRGHDQDLNTFKAALDQRLQGLSESHDLLLESIGGASLVELVRAQLNVVIGKDDLGLIDIYGPEISLDPKFVQTLGIGLYELATNSIKHGALRRREGSVKISWNLSKSKDAFVFIWQENGSHDNATATKGFGHVVLEHIVPESVGGTADLMISPVGISWVLKAPLSRVTLTAERIPPDSLTPALG